MYANTAATTIIAQLDVPALRGVLALVDTLAKSCRYRIDELEEREEVHRRTAARIQRYVYSGNLAARLVRSGEDFNSVVSAIAKRLDLAPDVVAANCEMALKKHKAADQKDRATKIMALAWAGSSNIEIAAQLRLNRSTVSRIIRRELKAKRKK